jgi:hypothetical protein
MKISEIYQLEPIAVKQDLGLIIESMKAIVENNYNSRYFELETLVLAWENAFEYEHKIDKNRYAIHMYMDESDDYDKYGARLFAIYFENIPMMLVKNHGRYFDTYEAFITNKKKLEEFVSYMNSIAKEFNKEKEITTFSEDEDIVGVEVINSYSLFDYYNKDLNQKYQIGDLVWAWVPENHLVYSFAEDYVGYVLTKVKISRFNKFNPVDTYHGSQYERGWHYLEKKEFSRKMQLHTTEQKSVGIGCSCNDSLIVGKVEDIPMPKMAINNFVDKDGFLNSDYKVLMEDIQKN